MNKRRQLAAGLLFVSLLLSACGGAPETQSPSETGSTSPTTFQVTATEWALPTLDTEAQVLRLLDAQGDCLLWSVNKKAMAPNDMYSYYETEQVLLYDARQGEVLSAWIPVAPGFYFSGAITGEGSAVIARTVDNDKDIPSQYALHSFHASQEELLHVEGEIMAVRGLENGSALISYRNQNGSFGLQQVSSQGVKPLITCQEDTKTGASAGLLSTWGNRFGYVFEEDGSLCLLEGDTSGETGRTHLEQGMQTLDSCCMTEEGILACLAVNEGEATAYRTLKLFGTPLEAQISAGRPLYRLCAGNSVAVAVDNAWNLQLIGMEENQLTCRRLSGITEALAEYNGSNVTLRWDGVDSFYFYFSGQQALFRVTIT